MEGVYLFFWRGLKLTIYKLFIIIRISRVVVNCHRLERHIPNSKSGTTRGGRKTLPQQYEADILPIYLNIDREQTRTVYPPSFEAYIWCNSFWCIICTGCARPYIATDWWYVQRDLPFLSRRGVKMLVGCGLTSHSAIFQLYSDGTVVQFSKFWPAAGYPTPWAIRGLWRAEPTPTRALGRPKTFFYLLATRVQTRGVGKLGIVRSTVQPATSTVGGGWNVPYRKGLGNIYCWWFLSSSTIQPL